MPPPLPVGLIGLGKHGARYLEHVRRDVPELSIAAVSRRDAVAGEAIAREIGARFHADARALVADPAVRAVIAVAPPSANGEIVEACVRERKPLLIEKPFAIGAVEAFRLRDLIEASGLPCLMAQTLRFSGVVRAVRELLPEIGPASQIVLGKTFEPTRLGWLDDPVEAGGGNILHTGVHMFDLLRLLTGGEVRDVECVIERVTTKRTEDSFVASMVVRLPGRAAVAGAPADATEGQGSGAAEGERADGEGRTLLASVYGSRATESRSGEIRVIGERGQIVADELHRRLAIIRGWHLEPLPDPPAVATVRQVLSAFRAVAEGAAAPPITARDGAAAVAIADACYRSAEAGRRVAVRTS